MEAGKYTLFAMPAEGNWTLLINKKTGIWGTEYDPSADVLHVPLSLEALPQHVETLTLSVKSGADGGVFQIEWEKTRAWAAFRTE